MSSNTEKLSELSSKLEAQTDYWGAKWLAFPYSWIVAAVVLFFAGVGVFTFVVKFM